MSRILAAVAHRVGGCIDTHITGVSVENGTVSASRWYYRQRMEGVVQREKRPWFILIDPGTQQAWDGAAGTATVEALTVSLPDSLRRTTADWVLWLDADDRIAAIHWKDSKAAYRGHTGPTPR